MATVQEIRRLEQGQTPPLGVDGMGMQRTGKASIGRESQSLVQKMSVSPHGSTPSAAQEKKPVCEICMDYGVFRMDVPLGDPNFGVTHRCSCKAVEDSRKLQALSGLSDLERSYRLSDIEVEGEARKGTRAMVNACESFLQEPYGILTIHGSCGNAKSHALCGMVNAMLETGCGAVYILAFDLVNYIRSAYSQKDNSIADDDAYARLTRFIRIPFLAVDEMDKIFPMSDWEAKQIGYFIDARYRWGMDGKHGLAIAMNGDPLDVFDGYWPILSRLRDGTNRIVENMDADLRPAMRR